MAAAFGGQNATGGVVLGEQSCTQEERFRDAGEGRHTVANRRSDCLDEAEE
jgi:hypothetical protein